MDSHILWLVMKKKSSSELYIYAACVRNYGGWDKRTEKAKAAWVMVAKSKPLKHLSTVGMTCIESALSAEHSAVPTLINARLPC